MPRYRIVVDVTVDDDCNPEAIAPAAQECLNRSGVFSDAKAREVCGELRTDRDDYSDWRYFQGPYADELRRFEKMLGCGFHLRPLS